MPTHPASGEVSVTTPGAATAPGAATTSPAAAEPEPAARKARPILGFILLGVFAIVFAVYASGDPAGDAGTAVADGADGAMGPPTLGEVDAPVVITEFSDFRCPFCQRHALQVKPRILADYVDTGVVRYEWKDLPFQGEESVAAALAARAAQEQGRFWDYHAGLFQRRDEGFTPDNLLRLASDLGLDLDDFLESIESGRHRELVQADFEEGRALGLQGTPAFVINGQIVVGAQPFDVFAEVIEAAHAEAGGA